MSNYPSQCECGHLFLEKYQFNEVIKGNIGFCWCGFCRTKVMVKAEDRETAFGLLDSPPLDHPFEKGGE